MKRTSLKGAAIATITDILVTNVVLLAVVYFTLAGHRAERHAKMPSGKSLQTAGYS
jgi:hypothetical protein